MRIRQHIKKGFGLNNLGHAYNDIYFLIIPLLLPLLRQEFNLSYTQAGFVLTTHIGVRSLFSYISGYLGDKYDKRIILAAGFFVASFFLAGLLLADNLFLIILFFIFLAIGVATFHPLATAIVGEEAVPQYRAFHIGIFESTGALGIIISTFTFGFFVDHLGWRLTCLLLALPGFPIAWAYLKSKKKEITSKIKTEMEVDRSYIMLFILALGIRGLGVGAIFSFLPTYGTDYLGLSAGVSSWLLTMLFFGSIFGALGGGWLSDKSSPLVIILVSSVLTVPLILGMTTEYSLFLVFLSIFLLGITNGSFFTTHNCWLTMISNNTNRSKMLGIAFLFDGVSITVSPTIFGLLADHFGLLLSLRWTLLPFALSIIMYFWLYRVFCQNQFQKTPVESLLGVLNNKVS